MTDVRALLAPIRARHEVSAPLCKDTCPSEECQAMQDRARLLAAIEAIESLVDEFEESSEGFGLDLQDDDFERGWHGARRETVAMIRTALAAALGSDTTNQEGTQ